MTQINYCKNCNSSIIPLGGTSVNVELVICSWCEHCRETKEEIQRHFFCSVKCFNDYMKHNEIVKV